MPFKTKLIVQRASMCEGVCFCLHIHAGADDDWLLFFSVGGSGADRGRRSERVSM